MRDRPDAIASLKDIEAPTLVVVGSDDAVTVPSMAETLHANINGSRLEVIPSAGHMSNLERPELFSDAVRGFLNSLP